MSGSQRLIIGLLAVALGICCVVGLGMMASNYTAMPTRAPVITAASSSGSVSTSVPTEVPTKAPTSTSQPTATPVVPTATPYEVTIPPQPTWTPTPDTRSGYEIEYQECMNDTEGVRLVVEWSTNVTEIKLGHTGEGVYWPDVPPEQYPTYRVSPPNAVCFALSQADVLSSGDDGVYVIAAVNNEPQGTAWIRCRLYVGTKLEYENENMGGWYTSVSCGMKPK